MDRNASPADLQGRCDPYISWRLQRAEAYRSVKDGPPGRRGAAGRRPVLERPLRLGDRLAV